jgi:hypothetical protein
MALQLFVVHWPLFQFLDLFTQSVEPLWWGISTSQGRYLHTGQHKHRTNAHRHPYFKWDSNPPSQCLRGRRQFMPQTVRPLWSADTSYFRKFHYQSAYFPLIQYVHVRACIAECFTKRIRRFLCEVMLDNGYTFCSWVHAQRLRKWRQ